MKMESDYDASIMNGTDGAAGSVVNVRRIRHPIEQQMQSQQGWPVMLNSEHGRICHSEGC